MLKNNNFNEFEFVVVNYIVGELIIVIINNIFLNIFMLMIKELFVFGLYIVVLNDNVFMKVNKR